MTERDWAEEAREHLTRAAEPLRVELREVELLISECEEALKKLVEARRFLKAQINRLVPSQNLKRPKAKKRSEKAVRDAGARNEAHVAARAELIGMVRKHISDNADKYKDGLTAAQVHREISASNGKGIIGPSVVKEIIENFHEVGFLRADRKVRGGAMSYKLVEGP